MTGFAKISRKLPLILLASAALVSFGVGYGSYVIGSQVVSDMTRQSLATLAHERAKQIDNYLRSTASDLEATATSPSVALSLRNFGNAWVQLGDHATAVLRQSVAGDSSATVDQDTMVTAAPALQTYKAQYGRDDPAFTQQSSAHQYGDFYLIGTTGDVYYSTAKGEEFATNLTNASSPAYGTGLAQVVAAALAAQGSTVSPSFVDFARYGKSGDLAAFMAMPVRAPSGAVAGVVAIRISPAVVASVAGDPTGLGQTGDILLMGADGKLRLDAAPSASNSGLATDFAGDAVMQAIGGAQAAGTYRAAGGTPVVIAAAPLQSLGTSWAVAATKSQAEAFAPVDAMRNTMFVVGACLLGVATLIGLLFARTITSPISRLTSTMERLAGGDLSIEVIGVSRRDEIGAMARTVEVFQANARRIASLTDEEHAASQSRRAERSAMMQSLQLAFGEVVEAAVVGDFGRRIDENQFSDRELRVLASSVNSLVETVNRGLSESGAVLASLARADLSGRVTGHYEGAFKRLKDDTNAVAEKFGDIVGRLRMTSRNLKVATKELLVGAADLGDRTSTQAATIEETSAAMEQLASAVVQNAQRAREASATASSVTSAADLGGHVMSEVTAAMEKITASSTKISDIIALIDDIAFQTNLLALNASVEAARAGDAGQGFAVVAVEVRRLAQSAGTASAQIRELIEQGGQEVRSGSGLVQRAADELETILEAARSSDALMNAIAEESKEQAPRSSRSTCLCDRLRPSLNETPYWSKPQIWRLSARSIKRPSLMISSRYFEPALVELLESATDPAPDCRSTQTN